MSTLYFRNLDDTSDEPVSDGHPLPVHLVRVDERTVDAVTWGPFETITVSSTATALTAALARVHTHALITVETAAVRFRLGTTAPTATSGHVLDVGDVLKIDNNYILDQIRFIRRDGTNATLQVSYGVRRYT